MNMLEAVTYWHACPYPEKRCRIDRCNNYIRVDPRPDWDKGIGPGGKGQRTLCGLLDDLNTQIMEKTQDARLEV